MLNRKLPAVPVEHFSMVPRNDVPRSTFKTFHSHKSTFDAGLLVPIFVKEMLPGDRIRGRMTVFARLATLLFPLMDNVTLESFFFFTPNRIMWTNWQRFMGEQINPGDSIAFTIPQSVSPAGGFVVGSIGDYMGLPTVGQVVAGRTVSVSALPGRMYRRIYNEWFRDENLINTQTVQTGDGPDTSLYTGVPLTRAKAHDYFTSALPWPLKGGTDVSLPLTGNANVLGIAWQTAADPTDGTPGSALQSGGVAPSGWAGYLTGAAVGASMFFRAAQATAGGPPLIQADLSTVTSTTINALRLAVTTQQFLERDGRGGTRYTELLRSHFGVTPEDSRLDRPEYIGGGKTAVNVSAVPITSSVTSAPYPPGNLAGASTVAGQHEFSCTVQEHGYIIGMVSVRADVTYQQGLHRMWTRQTRYDFYFPVFANLGEQALYNHEIYCQGSATSLLPVNPVDQDGQVFGYQERWAEYRHDPSRLSGLFRSTAAGNIDEWHLAQQFSSLPALNSTFVNDASAAVLMRAFTAGATANGMQVVFDSVFDLETTRPLPMFSVPGLARF